MEGFRLTAQARGSVKQEEEYKASYEDRAHLSQSYSTLRRSRSTPEDAATLPGFATFLRQSSPPQKRYERSRFAPSRPEPSMSLSAPNLAQPHTRDSHNHRRQPQDHHQLMLNYSPSAFTSTTGSRSFEESFSRTQGQRSAMSDASGGSPNLHDFKHIALNVTPMTSQPSSYRADIHSRANSEPARTRTNYKPHTTASNKSLTLSHQQQQQRPPARTSRYLREIDRRNILRRIEQGEKQANLAKEYQVSRAAISNLKQRRNNRNRKDVLQDRREASGLKKRGLSESDAGSYSQHLQQSSEQLTREQFTLSGTSHADSHLQTPSPLPSNGYQDERYESTNEHAQSPSPVSSPSTLSPFRDSEILSPMEEEPQDQGVIEVTTATMELLFTKLLDPRVDVQTAQTAKSRIARLVLETAMSEFPTRDLHIPMGPSPNTSRLAAMLSVPPYYSGAEFTKPTCAVKILSADCRGHGSVALLLQEFQHIEPFSEVRSISFSSDLSGPRLGEDSRVALPQNVHESNVLLLVDLLEPQSSDKVAQALQAILRADIQQRDVFVVTICSHKRALRRLLELFPQLRVVTAKIIDRGDPRNGDVAGFLHSRLSIQ